MVEAIRSIDVTEVTHYRWRSEYCGLKGDRVKRLKELKAEKVRLCRAGSANPQSNWRKALQLGTAQIRQK
jgi:hypothetical protein